MTIYERLRFLATDNKDSYLHKEGVENKKTTELQNYLDRIEILNILRSLDGKYSQLESSVSKLFSDKRFDLEKREDFNYIKRIYQSTVENRIRLIPLKRKIRKIIANENYDLYKVYNTFKIRESVITKQLKFLSVDQIGTAVELLDDFYYDLLRDVERNIQQ